MEIPVQVNGKVRSRLVAPAGSSDDQLKALALADEKVVASLAGTAPRKVIVVSGRLVNVVV
jgi:leucyl-tRNA synthetase